MKCLYLLVLLTSVSAYGASTAPSENLDLDAINRCNTLAKTTIQLQSCGEAEFAYYDKMLNASYKTLIGLLPDASRPVLMDAQRAWITFRDKDCRFISLENEGGSIQPLTSISCYSKLTKTRVQDFQSSIRFYRGDGKEGPEY